MDDWITVAGVRPVDSFGTVLKSYLIYDITGEECRQACIDAVHCLAYATYDVGTPDCYIYDSQVTSTPNGANAFYSGPTTLVDYKATTSYTTYGPNRTAVSPVVQSFLDSQGWVRYLDGVIPYSEDLSYVTSYMYLGTYEDECVEQCAVIAACIAIVYRNGNCYIYDSSAVEAPIGATSFTAGASEVAYMLGTGGSVRGAISFSAPLASLDESFMDGWIWTENTRPVDSFGTVLQYYSITDISNDNCRQWCLASWHCLAYAIYTYGDDDCYIYDSQASSGPDGSVGPTLYSGSTTLVGYGYADYYNVYGADPGLFILSIHFDENPFSYCHYSCIVLSYVDFGDVVSTLDMICDFTPARQRGYVVTSGISHLDSIRTVRCATGYEGTATDITCLDDGTWTQSEGCTTITADCDGDHVTMKLSSPSMNTCGGTCMPTADGTICQCGEGFQSSSGFECEEL